MEIPQRTKTKEIIMKIKDLVPANKPRNFVAKNAMKTTSGSGAHRDKKHEQKKGYEKHKNKNLDEIRHDNKNDMFSLSGRMPRTDRIDRDSSSGQEREQAIIARMKQGTINNILTLKPEWGLSDLELMTAAELNQILRDLQAKRAKKGVSEGEVKTQKYEMMLRNGQVKKFVAKDDADAKRIAAGHGAKSVIKLRGGVPAGKVSEQGVAEGYTGRETKDGIWRVFKDGKAVAVAGPFKSREEAAAWIKKQKQGVAEAGPFRSTEPKKPRKGSVADLADKKRKEQERNKPPIEPRDQMVGVAKVTKDVSEGEFGIPDIPDFAQFYNKKGILVGTSDHNGFHFSPEYYKILAQDFNRAQIDQMATKFQVAQKLKSGAWTVKQGVAEGSGPKEKQKTPYRDINSPEYRKAADRQKQQMANDAAAEPGKKLADKIAKKGVAEGSSGAKYKIKSIGKDSKGDYYISPSTGKKVYKQAKVGDHENPKTGEHKSQ